jgi:hypothetical protein
VEGCLCNIKNRRVLFCKKTGGFLVDRYGLSLTRDEARSRASIHDRTVGSCGGGRWRCQRRWTAGAERRRAGGEPKSIPRPPFRTGKIPEERGECGDLTGGLRTAKGGAGLEIHGEVGAPAVSFGGGGAPVPARATRGGEVVRVEQGVVLPLYRAEREGGKVRRRWSGSSTGRPLMAAAGGSVRRLREGKR